MPQVGRPIGSGRTAEVFEYGEGRVLKLFREGFEGYAANEFEISSVVGHLDLPAPKIFGMESYGNRMGIVYERVEGKSLLEAMKGKLYRVKRFGSEMGQLHHRIGQFQADGLPDVKDRLSSAIAKAPGLQEHERRQALASLQALPEGKALCHFDFHPNNIIVTPAGMKVIDWPNACIGSHFADLARTRIILESATVPPNASRIERVILQVLRNKVYMAYMQASLELSNADISEVSDWVLPVAAARLNEGIETEREYLLGIVRARLERLQEF